MRVAHYLLSVSFAASLSLALTACAESPSGGRPDTAKPNERYKINVFILARTLRSDALAVTVTREARLGDGNWIETTVARQVETDLENAILQRARRLKREWMATIQTEK